MNLLSSFFSLLLSCLLSLPSPLCLCLSLSLSPCGLVVVLLWCVVVCHVVSCCVVLCCVLSCVVLRVRCVVCDTLKNPVCPLNTSPCVHSKRPRHTCFNKCAWCASEHGDVLDVHTGMCWVDTRCFQRVTHHTPHTQHNTRQNKTQHNTT